MLIFICSNNFFGNAVKENMNKLARGDVMIFDDIKALHSDGKEIKMLPISIKVI